MVTQGQSAWLLLRFLRTELFKLVEFCFEDGLEKTIQMSDNREETLYSHCSGLLGDRTLCVGRVIPRRCS